MKLKALPAVALAGALTVKCVAAAAVTGEARVRLFRGSCQVAGRRAADSLYDHGLATYEQGDSFQHGAAAGFIHVWSLPTKTWAAATTEAAGTAQEAAPA